MQCNLHLIQVIDECSHDLVKMCVLIFIKIMQLRALDYQKKARNKKFTSKSENKVIEGKIS